ncbi:exopolyphosphatase PRUNE1-like [Pollicipes pollicipes]|uniref:exopolyphosphatase PRUNE1-like n=1 Tax=Pollicipes pollicipes TaxID=41117 RepID=UPI0018849B63|nr:exopolyphosphatase PRUNE1-like [Pollicipes pollicipes]
MLKGQWRTLLLDHHEPDRPLSDDVTIEPVGSCCTLVAERLFQLNRGLIDRTVADLLLGTIVLDTVNMSPAAQRVTPKDRLMASFLEPLSSGESHNQLFEMLQRAKGDVSQLSSFELLRKDQKTVEGAGLRLAVSSVPMLVKDYVRAPDAVSACNQLCQAAGRDLLVLMGSRAGGAEFCRDLAVFAVRNDLRDQVCALLEDSVSPCLGLSRVASPHPRLVLFTQDNVAASRKAVLPLLRGHVAGSGGSGDLSPVGRPAGRAPPPPPVTYSGLRSELPADVRPPNGIDLSLCAQAVTLLEPTSTGGSSQSSAYNSVPYTPQNSVADSDSIADVSLPSFNSRELLQRIELRRGPLGGFEGADDIGAYPFTPKNSFVESNLETAYRQMNIAELDSDMILQKVHEKKRKSNLFDDITEEEGSGPGGGGGGEEASAVRRTPQSGLAPAADIGPTR